MTSGIANNAGRTLRFLAAACAFALIGAAHASAASASGAIPAGAEAGEPAPLLLCPECGREAPDGAARCPSCGAALSTRGGAAAQPAGYDPAQVAASLAAPQAAQVDAARVAARDVAEARRLRDAGDFAGATVLYRNAQALLMAGASPAATRTVAAEASEAVRDFEGGARPASRAAALAAADKKAETFFRGEGRIPFGRAWVPADWPTTLPPPTLAAIRLSLPPNCPECVGAGTVHCRACAGSGAVPCKAQGCKNGWVTRKPTNTLSPKTDISIREKCPVCHGTAHVACRDCAGRGAVSCKKCGGTGEAPLCKGCRGTGLEDCRECARKGIRPDCPSCRGTGKTLCRKCGGDGRQPR